MTTINLSDQHAPGLSRQECLKSLAEEVPAVVPGSLQAAANIIWEEMSKIRESSVRGHLRES